jgi:hypothetical protein
MPYWRSISLGELYRLQKICRPTGPRTSLDGHAPEEISDLYSKLNGDTLFRQEWPERVGLGFQLVHVGYTIQTNKQDVERRVNQ